MKHALRESPLTQAQHYLSLVLTHTGEGIYCLDKKGDTVFVNNAAADMLKMTREQIKGVCKHMSVRHPTLETRAHTQHDCPIHATLNDGISRHGDNIYFYRADGSFFPVEYFINPILDSGEVTGAVVTFIDISERKKTDEKLFDYQTKLENMVDQKTRQLQVANDRLRKMAMFDSLTGIANRRAFDDALNREVGRAARKRQPMTLMLADIDYFKQYNDLYGHTEGDQCLKQIAQCIQRSFRRSGDLVARYGGEEFAVILPETNLHDSTSQAGRLLTEIRSLKIPHAESLCSSVVSLSLGLVNTVPEPKGSLALIKLADQALYHAKHAGRNQYWVA